MALAPTKKTKIFLFVTWSVMLICSALLVMLRVNNSHKEPNAPVITEGFDSFSAKLQLDRDGILSVVENMSVRVDGKYIKKGFCRRFLAHYTDRAKVKHVIS